MEQTFFLKYTTRARENNFNNILSLEVCEHLRDGNPIITNFILLQVLVELMDVKGANYKNLIDTINLN